MAATPHIKNLRQVLRLLDEGKSIALPGVLINKAFWRLTKHAGGLLWLEPDRLIPTPKTSKEKKQATFQSGLGWPAFLREASNYAESNWPCSLCVDNSVFSGWFELCDPRQTSMGERGGCRPITAGCATFRTSLERLKRLPPEQRFREFNHSVIYGSVASIERDELRGQTATLFRYCSVCGHWLEPNRCPGCKITFPAFQVPHTQEFVLPDRLTIGWRQAGRLFTRNPSAWR